jgi:amino acid transporter
MCLDLGFERLVTIDIIIYGSSLVLEFVALAVLRFREPGLPRPFRVPGGIVGAIAVGIPPTLMLGFAVVHSQNEKVLGISALVFAIMLITAGVLAYFLNTLLKPHGWGMTEERSTASF